MIVEEFLKENMKTEITYAIMKYKEKETPVRIHYEDGEYNVFPVVIKRKMGMEMYNQIVKEFRKFLGDRFNEEHMKSMIVNDYYYELDTKFTTREFINEACDEIIFMSEPEILRKILPYQKDIPIFFRPFLPGLTTDKYSVS